MDNSYSSNLSYMVEKLGKYGNPRDFLSIEDCVVLKNLLLEQERIIYALTKKINKQ